MIELMVTVFVMAVLVTLAAPSFRDMIDKSRLRGATDDIINLLNIARASAVKLHRDVNVSVEKGSAWCAGAVSAPDPANVGDAIGTATVCDCAAGTVACLVDGAPMLTSAKAYGSGSTATLASGNANKLLNSNNGIVFSAKFGALDLASTLPTTLTVTSPLGKYSAQISVSPLGETYVCTPVADPPVPGYPSC
jgi:type IV fimbrial biogenesis protein FimT